MFFENTSSIENNSWVFPFKLENSTVLPLDNSVLPLNFSGRLNDSIVVFNTTEGIVEFPIDDSNAHPDDVVGLVCVIFVIVTIIILCTGALAGAGHPY